jgi:acetyl esterase/lipase
VRNHPDFIVTTAIVYTVPGMDDVRVHSNLRYRPDESGGPMLDAYAPSGLSPTERRPAVVLIHGGVPPGERAKDWPLFQTWGRLLAASGFVGITFNHRLGFPKANLTQAAADVRAAIAYARDNVEHVDRDRVCLLGFSAGGPLLGTGLGADTTFVRCLVAFYAFLDIRQSPLHADEGPPEFLRQYSPAAFYGDAKATVPPIFVARAGLDMQPLNAVIDQFAVAALKANAPLTLMNHPRGRHGFDALDDDARSREIIRAAVAFMHTHLTEV